MSTPTTRQLWPSTEYLATWIDRNCKTCRFNQSPQHLDKRTFACHIPKNILTAWINNTTPSYQTLSRLFAEHVHRMGGSTAPAPYKCASRKDNRGRPAANERIPNG